MKLVHYAMITAGVTGFALVCLVAYLAAELGDKRITETKLATGAAALQSAETRISSLAKANAELIAKSHCAPRDPVARLTTARELVRRDLPKITEREVTTAANPYFVELSALAAFFPAASEEQIRREVAGVNDFLANHDDRSSCRDTLNTLVTLHASYPDDHLTVRDLAESQVALYRAVLMGRQK